MKSITFVVILVAATNVLAQSNDQDALFERANNVQSDRLKQQAIERFTKKTGINLSQAQWQNTVDEGNQFLAAAPEASVTAYMDGGNRCEVKLLYFPIHARRCVGMGYGRFATFISAGTINACQTIARPYSANDPYVSYNEIGPVVKVEAICTKSGTESDRYLWSESISDVGVNFELETQEKVLKYLNLSK